MKDKLAAIGLLWIVCDVLLVLYGIYIALRPELHKHTCAHVELRKDGDIAW